MEVLPDINSLSPADILTAVGYPLVAALVTGLVEVIKRLSRSLGSSAVAGREQVVAAILAGVFVGLAVADVITTSGVEALGGLVGTVFVVILSWYGILRLAMGVYDDATQKVNSLTGPTGEG